MASPLLIKTLFAYYCSPHPHEQFTPEQWGSPAAIESRKWLREKELLDTHDKITAQGIAWVSMICMTPVPVQKWVDPRFDKGEE